MSDLDILKSIISNLKFALLDAYTIESIASFQLEENIKKAIEEANRLIEDGEI